MTAADDPDPGPSPAVLIAGCGDLGTEAGLRFAARGWRVFGLRRTATRLRPPIEAVAADLGGELDAPLERLPPVLDALVITPSADSRSEDAYRRAYLDGPANLLDTLERLGRRPRRVLAVSSTGVYGVDDGTDVDEHTPTVPASPTGQVLVEAEQALHGRRPDAVILRLAGIYGPGRTRLIDQVRSGTPPSVDPPVVTNRIHRDDAAAAIVHLLMDVDDPAPVYLGVDDVPVERHEVLRFLSEELGLLLPPAPDAPDPAADDPSRPQPRRGRAGNKRCHNDLLRATGFRFTYPSYREGYRAILDGRGSRHP